ncbi:MAG: alpha/beta fold hydrolase [Candidatus Binataceae bacterium]
MFENTSGENTNGMLSGGQFRGHTVSSIAQTAVGPIEYFSIGEGPALLGMHGTPGGYDQVALISGRVAARGFRIIGWSRPGYLSTPLEVGRTPQEQADAAARLLDALGIDRVCVYGASGGGPATYNFAARHPDRTWAMVTECAISKRFGDDLNPLERMLLRSSVSGLTMPVFDWFASRFPETLARQIIRLQGTLDPQAARAFASEVDADPAKSAFVNGLFQTMNPLGARKAGLLNDLDQFERIDRLPLEEINCPALIIHGTHDADVRFEHGEFAARSIPHAEFLPVEGGTHVLWITRRAEELRARRIEFLTRHMPA